MRIVHVALASLLASAASACVITPVRTRAVIHADVDDDGVEDVVVVDNEPPPVYNEVVTAAPYPGAIWIGGYWGWHGHRHSWIAGHWEHRRDGYTYRPHRWVHRHGRWHLRAGGWVALR